jgi:hypothetical protein
MLQPVYDLTIAFFLGKINPQTSHGSFLPVKLSTLSGLGMLCVVSTFEALGSTPSSPPSN